MGALARATMDPDFPAEIVLVLSNRPKVRGLELAKEHGIEIQVIDHKEFANRDHHDQAVGEALESVDAELVCLAGYMRILGDDFIAKWRGKLINIHPSLLPSFRGIETHARALERGVRIHGCTVHFVNAELDAGPIIAQAAVPVLPGDTEETLRERVLEVEHTLYPKALRMIANQTIRWSGDNAVKDLDISSDDVAIWSP